MDNHIKNDGKFKVLVEKEGFDGPNVPVRVMNGNSIHAKFKCKGAEKAFIAD